MKFYVGGGELACESRKERDFKEAHIAPKRKSVHRAQKSRKSRRPQSHEGHKGHEVTKITKVTKAKSSRSGVEDAPAAHQVKSTSKWGWESAHRSSSEVKWRPIVLPLGFGGQELATAVHADITGASRRCAYTQQQHKS